jgi:DNA-binding NarL/FixJ family response regulator
MINPEAVFRLPTLAQHLARRQPKTARRKYLDDLAKRKAKQAKLVAKAETTEQQYKIQIMNLIDAGLTNKSIHAVLGCSRGYIKAVAAQYRRALKCQKMN